MKRKVHHSVTLDETRCTGCTNCIKRCPTQAIRVRDGKARILDERCIDCGECIRRCPHHAKQARYDTLERLQEFRYTIALPAPTLYGQFQWATQINEILTGLLELGFDHVFEVSRSAELISQATGKFFQSYEGEKPLINSACPAVVRLIRVQFPQLCSRVLPIMSPMQAAAKLAKEEAMAKTGLQQEEIGVFFLTPCPAKVTAAQEPFGIDHSWVDGAIAISYLYPKLSEAMKQIQEPLPLCQSGIWGIGWANSGGESSALHSPNYLAADGIENVMEVLEAVEEERLGGLDFIELNACPGGCVGGVLTVSNPYVAKARIQNMGGKVSTQPLPPYEGSIQEFYWNQELTDANVLKFSDNLKESLVMMAKVEAMDQKLPGLDCGSCGAPTCRTLAEDIVAGNATLTDCIFVFKEQMLGGEGKE